MKTEKKIKKAVKAYIAASEMKDRACDIFEQIRRKCPYYYYFSTIYKCKLGMTECSVEYCPIIEWTNLKDSEKEIIHYEN